MLMCQSMVNHLYSNHVPNPNWMNYHNVAGVVALMYPIHQYCYHSNWPHHYHYSARVVDEMDEYDHVHCHYPHHHHCARYWVLHASMVCEWFAPTSVYHRLIMYSSNIQIDHASL